MDYTLDKKLQGFRQIAQEKLQSILCSIPDNQKDLVIEPILIKPLEQICGASWLRAKGINKIYKFDEKNGPQIRSTLVYFLSANLLVFKQVIDQIHLIIGQEQPFQLLSKQPSSSQHQHQQSLKFSTDIKSFHIIVFPNVLHSFELLLEEEGLYGLVGLHRYNWDFITMDTNLLSLEIPQLFNELFMKNDTSLLSSMAHSFRIFNMIINVPPKMILTYGKYSEKLLQMVERLEGYRKDNDNLDTSNDNIEKNQSDFNTIIFIDRDKDYPSCLLTPVVYSGLLLELFPMKSGQLQIDIDNTRIKSGKLTFLQPSAVPTTTNASSTTTKRPDNNASSSSNKDIKQLHLNGMIDKIYHENCYKHFIEVTNLLSAQSKALGMETKNLKDMNLIEMREYVSKQLPKITTHKKELFKHLILCETIINELGGNFDKLQQLEESMLCNHNKKQIVQRLQEWLSIDGHRFLNLRHVCLLYVTCGLPVDDAKQFMTDYLNTFGYNNLPIFQRLSVAKLFPDICMATNKTSFTTLTAAATTTTANINNLLLPRSNEFQSVCQKLKLLPSDHQQPASTSTLITSKFTKSQTNERNDTMCPGYVFNGTYIPMIAQICNLLLATKSFNELQMNFGGIEQLKFYKYLNKFNCNYKDLSAQIKRMELIDLFPIKQRTIFIFIIGGVTYAEIAACNLIGELTNSKIILSSNCILSGSDLMEAAFS